VRMCWPGELADFLGDTVRRVYSFLEGLPRVVLVHGGGELLPQFEPSMRRRAIQALEKQGIEVRLRTRAVRVNERSIDLTTIGTTVLASARGTVASNKPIESSSVETLPAGVVVWSGGTSPRPLTVALAAQLEILRSKEAGDAEVMDGAPSSSADLTRLATDRFCRALGSPCGSILAIGDAAQVVDVVPDGSLARQAASSGTASTHGAGLPPTAQVAAQAGAYVARLLNRGYDLSALPTPTLKQVLGTNP
jgi:NADH dehydrogenase FAD-containing subunit